MSSIFNGCSTRGLTASQMISNFLESADEKVRKVKGILFQNACDQIPFMFRKVDLHLLKTSAMNRHVRQGNRRIAHTSPVKVPVPLMESESPHVHFWKSLLKVEVGVRSALDPYIN